jgi:hypothetical protein
METREQRIWWIFRVATAMCFIGHGAFGILTKAEWIPFFSLVGLSTEAAYTLMPLIGAVDIAIGLAVLFRPIRAALLYMAVWALWTAALRPLTGDSVFEMLERAGNYGVPIAFLLFLGPVGGWRDWLAAAHVPSLTPEREALVRHALLVTTVLLLVGHAGLALGQKPLLVGHASAVGLSAASVVLVGWVELALAALVLAVPAPAVLVGVAAWKIGTEMLFPVAGAPIWEFIERGGSYGAPLALAVLQWNRITLQRRFMMRLQGWAPSAVLLLVLSALPASLAAQATSISPRELADSLRRGGFTIVCRHAATNHEQHDNGPERSQQRNLTAEGEAQAKEIGVAIRALGIPVSEVRANPMYRNQETATYAFGRMDVDSTLGGREAGKALRAMLMAPVPRGTNRAVVTRVGILTAAMQDHGVRNIGEGDCFVAQPIEGPEFKVLGRIRPQEWKPLIGGG